MKHIILMGAQAVSDFQKENWEDLELAILKDFNGDIIGWDDELDTLPTLLDMLSGWDDFTELSESDIKNIQENTKIEIPKN